MISHFFPDNSFLFHCFKFIDKVERAALGVVLGDALDDLLPVMLGVEALPIS